MTLQEAITIRGIWDGIETLEPDISTERLMVTTAQVASHELGTYYDEADVADALILTREKRKR